MGVVAKVAARAFAAAHAEVTKLDSGPRCDRPASRCVTRLTPDRNLRFCCGASGTARGVLLASSARQPLMCLLIVLIPAFHAFSSPATEYVITATPWCDNSLRLQVKPAAVPALALALTLTLLTLTLTRSNP